MNKLKFIGYNIFAFPFLVLGYTTWAIFKALEEIIQEYKFNFPKRNKIQGLEK